MLHKLIMVLKREEGLEVWGEKKDEKGEKIRFNLVEDSDLSDLDDLNGDENGWADNQIGEDEEFETEAYDGISFRPAKYGILMKCLNELTFLSPTEVLCFLASLSWWRKMMLLLSCLLGRVEEILQV